MDIGIIILLINSKGEILLQKRSPNKEKNPNLWDLSCAGHLNSRDSSISGAMRELEEELGIKSNEQNMKLIYTIRKSYMPKEGFIENEIQDVYLYRADVDINNIKMQKEEVLEVKFIPFEIYAKEILSNNKEFVNRGNEFREIIEIIKRIL
ncbi:MAG: NUDIX domain-containing protein [Clostridia bacterium]|nr:NUDIX domain-containing protein [Clostridia bacterium]